MEKDVVVIRIDPQEPAPAEFKNLYTKKEYIDMVVEGYRFEPTDEELLVFYLKKKVNGEELPIHIIHEANIYEFSPEILTRKYELFKETMELYFFTPRAAKYPNGSRPDRAARTNGYWKLTGTDTKIKVNGGEVVGSKKCLDYYVGPHKNSKRTTWKMHEYVLENNNIRSSCKWGRDGKKLLNDCVLCCIYKYEKRRNHQSKDAEEKPEDLNGEQQIPVSTLQPQDNDALTITVNDGPHSSNQWSCFYDRTILTMNNTEPGLPHNYENSSSFITMPPTPVTKLGCETSTFCNSYPSAHALEQNGIGFVTSNNAQVVEPSAAAMDKVNEENFALFNGANSSPVRVQSSCGSSGLLEDVINECRKINGTSICSLQEPENPKGKEVVTSDHVGVKEASAAVKDSGG